MDLSSRGPKNPLCKFSWSYDDRYYIDFMVRTDPRITEGQTDRQTARHTHPQTTGWVSVENDWGCKIQQPQKTCILTVVIIVWLIYREKRSATGTGQRQHITKCKFPDPHTTWFQIHAQYIFLQITYISIHKIHRSFCHQSKQLGERRALTNGHIQNQ